MDAFSPQSDDDPTETLVRSVRRIAQAIDVRSREIARQTGLTLPQILVLQSIRALGEVSTGALSREVSMSSPTVVAVLDRLEARGVIERYRSTIDRRIVHARLTAVAEAALAGAPGLLGGDALAAWKALPLPTRQSTAQALAQLAALMTTSASVPAESGE